MSRNTYVTEQPVVLDGYQAVMTPSQHGFSLHAIIDQTLVDRLEEDRVEALKWAESKLKNPKRTVLKPEPWEEVSDGKYKVKFSWKEELKPPIVDTEGTPITELLDIRSGSKVKLAFYQKPYVFGDAYGTSLKLKAIQLVSLSSGAGVDIGDMSTDDAAALFGTTQGFKQSEPNVIPADSEPDEDDF
tara:strand:+ start:579 stop:1139 length:561 start_codon:yes stop_codon:yes gene_type:complete